MTRPDYPPLQLRIGSRWVDAGDRATLPVVNPADETVLGHLPCATSQDIDAALNAARDSFAPWRDTSPVERARVLRRAAETLREERETLAGLIALELGKPLREGLKEIETGAGMFEWAAEEGRRAYGRIIPPRNPAYRLNAVPEPVGPVAGFAGWNAPVITPARKIAGALAAGCSIIIKPSEATPATALFLARALAEAGLPDGVVNLLSGDPAAIAEQLLRSPVTRMVTFTGSTAVGKQLAALATQSMMRMVFELGGHAPVLVFPDTDVDAVVKGAVASKYRNSGQVCTSPTRFYVHESVYPDFVEAFTERAASLRLGDPFSEEAQMGPVQNPRRLAALQSLVQDARQQGATVTTGGEALEGPGFFFQPTVLTNVSDDCRAVSEEPFGPLAMISPFPTTDEAIALANRLPVGLASYLFTQDTRVVARVSREIQCGNLSINQWAASFPETPFGGVLDSGVGSEGGVEGLQAFQQIKFVSQAPEVAG